MPVFNNILAGAAGSGGAADFQIERSLRFNDDDSAYLNKTPSSAGNRTTFTFSCWVKRASTGSYQTLFSSYESSGNFHHLRFRTDEKLETRLKISSVDKLHLITDQVFRDFAWYHVVFVYDSTQSTASDRAKLYVNGIQVTNFSTETYPSQNEDSYVGNASAHYIGQRGDSQFYYDGLLADVHFLDGIAVSNPDGVFGEFDADTGVWNPIRFTGSYGQGLTTSQATGSLPIYNTTDDYGAVKGSGTRTDSSSSNIELAVAMDGTNGGTTFTDEHATIKGSGSAVALTAVGNVQTVTSQNKFYGSSASFDGSGDYLSFTNIDLQRSSFTYEAWVYATDATKLLPTVIFTAGYSSGIIHSFGLANSSAAMNAVFGAATRPSSGNYWFQAPAITANAWNHIAWVRNGTTISIYVNGVGQTLDTTNGGNGGRDEVTNVSYIGSNDLNEDFSGYIQDARVYSSAKYTADFTVPGISNSFHLDFSSSTLGEDKVNSNDWTANNLFSFASNYANSVSTATNGEVPNGGTPYIVDVVPTNANLSYGSNDIVNVFNGVYNSGGVYWVGDQYSTGNVTRARFDLRDFPNVTSVRWYGGRITGSYIPYTYQLLDENKNAISGTSGTATEGNDWNVVTVAGSPRYLEFSCTSGSGRRNWLYSIEVNGTLLQNAEAAELDVLFDSPTNYDDGTNVGGNYCVLNPLNKNSNTTLSNGNLGFYGGGYPAGVTGTIGVSSGKWYYEINPTAGPYDPPTIYFGFADVASFNLPSSGYIYLTAGVYTYCPRGAYKQINGTQTATGFGNGNLGSTFGVALDLDNGTLQIYQDGTLLGTLDSTMSGTFVPLVYGDTGSAGDTANLNFGQRPFKYPPGGTGGPAATFKGICTQNLDDPLIADPSTVFDIDTYTGNGGTQERSEFSFEPDLVWIKARSATYNHYLVDQVRGFNGTNARVLQPNLTNAEESADGPGDSFASFDNDGFTVKLGTGGWAGTNQNNVSYTAWAWDVGTSAASSNTDGSITSSVRASQTAGISIVSWTASTQSAAYVGHGLGKQPELIIAKTRDGTGNWYVFEPSLDTGGTISKALYLNDSSAKVSVSGVWGHWDEMTSTTFGITDSSGSGTNDGDMIAYCFTSVNQFSQFGVYTGNGSADGCFVSLSFRPAFLLLKRTDSTGNWLIYDDKREGYNFDNDPLYANLGSAEGTTDYIDLLSNGFKIRNTHSSINASGGTYIYAAFASSPIKYARAR